MTDVRIFTESLYLILKASFFGDPTFHLRHYPFLFSLPITLSVVFLDQPSPALTLAQFPLCNPAATIANLLASSLLLLLPDASEDETSFISLRMPGFYMSEPLRAFLTIYPSPYNLSVTSFLPRLFIGGPFTYVFGKSPLTSLVPGPTHYIHFS